MYRLLAAIGFTLAASTAAMADSSLLDVRPSPEWPESYDLQPNTPDAYYGVTGAYGVSPAATMGTAAVYAEPDMVAVPAAGPAYDVDYTTTYSVAVDDDSADRARLGDGTPLYEREAVGIEYDTWN